MDILNDSSFWLSMTSLILVCGVGTLKQIYKFKLTEISCFGCVKIHRDTELEGSIDRHNLDIIPQPSSGSNSDSLRSIR